MRRILRTSLALLAVGLLAAPVDAQQRGRGPGMGGGANWVDANGDGVCDNFQAGGRGQGSCAWCGFGANGGSLVDIAATTLGRARPEVVADLRQGKTLAQVMEAGGKTAQDLVNAVVANRKTALDRAVSTNALTTQQAEDTLARIRTHVTQMVSQPWSPGGWGHHGGHHGRW